MKWTFRQSVALPSATSSSAPQACSKDELPSCERRFSPLRPCVLALVFFAHATLFGFLFRPVALRMQVSKAHTDSDALQVRFHLSKSDKSRSAVKPTRRAGFIPPNAAMVRSASASPPEQISVTPTTIPVSPPELVSPGDDFIPGGGIFRHVAGAHFSKQGVRVPGASPLSGAPRLRMVDPRKQGLGGVVRFIGGLTGAVDRHCLDVEAWRGMTPAERTARHVSSGEIEEIAGQYNCDAQRRGSNGMTRR